jgi:hemerythrin-like domain-containing protein
MVEMSMNKAIHGAFRRDMTRFLKALAAFEPGDSKRAQQLATAWANFDDELTYHHQGEHEIAWPALEAVGVSRELLDEMDAEHDTMASALSETRIAMAAFARSAQAADAAAAHRAFERLQTMTLAHFDHEEAEIEPVYLAKRDDPVIKAMGRKFGKVSPVRGGRFMAWMTDGASPEEMAAIKDNVPPPVLAIIGGIFGRGYRKDIAPTWKQ